MDKRIADPFTVITGIVLIDKFMRSPDTPRYLESLMWLIRDNRCMTCGYRFEHPPYGCKSPTHRGYGEEMSRKGC
jgi:hypothetical protein